MRLLRRCDAQGLMAGVATAFVGLACQEPRTAPETTPFTPPDFAVTTVDSVWGSNPIMLLEGTSGIHIVYWNDYPDYNPLPVGYARCAGACDGPANWAADRIQAYQANSPVAAVLSDGALHVAYVAPDNSLGYSSCAAACTESQQWQTIEFDSTSGWGSSVSLTADSSGTLHLVYTGQDSSGAVLRYASCGGGCSIQSNWVFSTIANGAMTFDQSALRVDPAGRLHLAVLQGKARYGACDSACSDAKQWQFKTLDSGAVSLPSLAVGSTGAVDISYSDSGTIRYAHCEAACATGGKWNIIDIGRGTSPQLQRDAAGKVYLVFYGSDNHLAYAECDASCQSATQWRAAPILSDRYAGSFSFVVSAYGEPRIAFNEFDNFGRLAVAVVR